ncbi:hypothetical protein RE476_10635 [Methanolobus mangrovi]|uniref:Uncharacterized protein n=1 Tax=Methanolobus mangrovi TaxID=3072977 RepID=A0AA51UHJ9_9EURY|nr:hypothetical protein [Methanolobus mangrovi]WMW21821.1 hypothetical protein RE476_10635 [Methanolobus mangrovi]
MKNDNQIKEDINGRLHSVDQTVRSVEKRLRAVERRLSVDVPLEDVIPEYETNFEEALEHTREEIAAIHSDIDELKQGSLQYQDYESRFQELDSELTTLNSHITELQEENSKLSEQLNQEKQQKPESISLDIKNEITQLSMHLEKAENHNRINIGSVKVPVELSGIVGAVILALTGYLIMAGRWDIVRSAYFSFSIAFVFAAAVLLKFYMANSKRA